MIFILQSQKNKAQLVSDNFIYNKKSTTQTTTLWCCIRKSCNATARTTLEYRNNLNSFTLICAHNHENDQPKIVKKIKENEMKAKLTIPNFTPRSIINDVLRGADRETILSIGNYSLLSRNLRNQRINIINPKPYFYPTLKISKQLSLTHTNKPFYRYGPEKYQNFQIYEGIIIFFSDGLAEKLAVFNTWCIDGTFSILPRPYKQMVTIGFIRDHHVFPVVFGLLKDKKFKTYINFLKIVKILIPNLGPQIIKVDFEMAFIQALKTSFPDSYVSGCLFHLSQALIRKLQKEKLICQYNTNPIFKKFVKCLLCLSFVKKEKIVTTFNELKTNILFPRELDTIYNYFFRNYVGDSALFPIDLWHCSYLIENNIPRTNNAIEGWHFVFKSTFNNAKNSLPLLFQKLKDEEDAIRIKEVQFSVGFSFERNKKYLLIENNLIAFMTSNENVNFGVQFVFDLCDLLFY